MLCVALAANAQFTLVPGKLVAEGDKAYYVVEMDGTQQELYNKAKGAITTLFRSAKDVISEVPTSQIKINAVSVDDVYLKIMGHKESFTMEYTMNILVKDGRIRFDAPIIDKMWTANNKGNVAQLYADEGGGSGMTDYGHIFKKNGDVRYNEAKQSIENYFNTLVKAIVSNMQSDPAEEDW